MIAEYSVNFRMSSGVFFATFDVNGIMKTCTNTGVAMLFVGKDLSRFILFCRYNEFEFWG